MKLVLGITGASGAPYFVRLVEYCKLLKRRYDIIYIVYTEQAEIVFRYENNIDINSFLDEYVGTGCISNYYRSDEWASPLASSSSLYDADMVIVPCSMNTVARLAAGIQDNILLRAAHIVLRMRNKLVIVPRETPLSVIDLRNLYRLALYGAIVLPASPGFYSRPRGLDEILDFVVGKIMDVLGIENSLYRRWGEQGYRKE